MFQIVNVRILQDMYTVSRDGSPGYSGVYVM